MRYTRRRLLVGIGLAGLGAAMSPLVKKADASSLMNPLAVGAGTCPFRLAVINDEITQDFEKVCQIVSGDFGLLWIELRSMWNKNVTELDAKQVEERGRFSKNTSCASRISQARCSRQTGLGLRGLRKVKRATSSMRTSMPARRISCWSGVSRLPNLSIRRGFAVSTTGGWMIRSLTGRRSTRNCSRLRNAAPKTTSSSSWKTRCPATQPRAKRRLLC
jgi:hypothetical protein